MAKKSMLEREQKRILLVKKYLKKRQLILLKLKEINNNEINTKLRIILEKLPKNSSIQRLKNRCWKTGKPRGYIRYFGLCRNAFRELALNCSLPGIIKSSW
jgi:small subunit ribosomal protein S14